MLTSLFTGVSGMNANGTALSVIGDNIANMNTVGFKASRVSFGDVLSQTLAGSAGNAQVGRGVIVSSVLPLFTQGALQSTESALDLAIEGEGFFVVSDASGANYYTRAGQFSLDKNGNIVTPDGLVLQGYQVDAFNNITGTVGALKIAATQSAANATTTANIAVNLDASEAVKTWAFTAGTTTPPASTDYNKSMTMTAYDALGGAHDVTLYFVKTADNAWTTHYIYKDSAGMYQEAGTQDLTFNDGATPPAVGGSLATDNAAALTFAWGGGVADGSITFDFGTGTADTPPGDGLDGSTQFASVFAVLNETQNGYSAGALKNIMVSEDGLITGIFTNGQTRNVGQVVLAKFNAPTGLTKMGRNLYAESFDSGQPVVGAANTSGLGRVLSNTLEQSNVDLAMEFVKMISYQRGFQANSKIITVTDELMQVTVNLK